MTKKFNSIVISFLFLIPLLKPISTKLGLTLVTSNILLLHTNKANAKNADFWNKKGNESFNKGNYLEAVSYFSELLKKDPKSFKGYYNRGLSRLNIGDHYGAIIDFLKGIELNPNDSNFYNQLSNAYIELKKYKKSIDYITTAIKIDPSSDYFYSERGYLFELVGNPEKAMLDYKKALEINDSDPYNYYALSNAQNNFGNTFYSSNYQNASKFYQDALENIKKAIELKNNDPVYYFTKGLINNNLNNFEETCADFQKASDLGYEFGDTFRTPWNSTCNTLFNYPYNFDGFF